MRISNTLLAAALALAPAARADDILLSGGTSRLTGNVRAIDASGAVVLDSPLSPEPLWLKDGAVRQVAFTPSPRTGPEPDAMLELANGDQLPVTVLGMEGDELRVASPDLGNLTVNRRALRSLQVGVRGRNTIYQGPRSLEEWTDSPGDPQNWEFREGALVADGNARAAADLKLPRNFVLKFTIVWEGNPNLQISFADPFGDAEEARDRYYLQFNRAGLEIKRESSVGRRYPPPIILLNRTPDQYPDRRLEVEIGVDRATARLQLFLNGEPEGVFGDPILPVPTAGGVGLTCSAPSGQNIEILDIRVLEFDDSHRRHRSEDRGDPDTDSLISRDEDRWGGRLLDIRGDAADLVFRFRSDFQDDPLEIPMRDVSTVFFTGGEASDKDEDAPPFVLRVRSNGSLRVKSSRFAEGRVEAEHPVLGPIRFAAGSVTEMEWVGKEEKPKGGAE